MENMNPRNDSGALIKRDVITRYCRIWIRLVVQEAPQQLRESGLSDTIC
jgi:hypothetical protein